MPLPTKEDLRKLPRRAVVAFAARCARRVETIVLRSNLSEDHKRTVSLAIEVAEKAAATAARPARAARAARAAASAVVAVAADFRAARAARAAAAAASAVVAHGPYVDGAVEAVEAADAAAAAALGARTAVRAGIAADYRLLVEAARSQAWNDKTPVPQSVFGLLWPEGEPDWESLTKEALRAKRAQDGESAETARPADELGFDVWIDPGNASVEDIQALFQALSDLNRAHGGTGLTFVSGAQKALVLENA